MLRILIFLVPLSLGAQISLSDNFRDGTFHSHPPWWGDSANFKVTQKTLQLADTVGGESYLALASLVAEEASWYFKGRVDFNPSSSNFLDLIVLSDQDSLDLAFKGYFLRVGNSKDQICFYRSDGTHDQSLFCSADDLVQAASVDFQLQLKRSDQHLWHLSAAINGSSWQAIDSIVDSTYTLARAAGWHCHYTKTRAEKFYLDSLHIQGYPVRDSAVPYLDSLYFASDRDLSLFWNEEIREPDSVLSNGYPLAISLKEGASNLNLQHPSSFPKNDTFSLSIYGLSDIFGNRVDSALTLFYYYPAWGDLRFSEIMADPSPPVGSTLLGFPEAEYLELYNDTKHSVNFRHWQLLIDDKSYFLKDQNLLEGAYLTFCDQDLWGLWPDSLKPYPLAWSPYELRNEGTFLALISPQGIWVDSLYFRKSWYRDPHKSEGGWSLECQQIDLDCRGASNWQASRNKQGGSPGWQNSFAGMAKDSLAPTLTRVAMPRPDHLIAYFDEELWLDSIAYELADLKVTDLWKEAKALHVFFAEDLKAGKTYTLKWHGLLRDCQGNYWQGPLSFGFGAEAKEGDLRISEVLFNPKPGDQDFVELYNRGSNLVDLSQLRLAPWQAEAKVPGKIYQIVTSSFLLAPQDALVLCEEPQLMIAAGVAPDKVLGVSELPTLPDKGEDLALLNSNLELLDRALFKAEWHAPFLADEEGVSLKRRFWQDFALRSYHWESSNRAENYSSPGTVQVLSPGEGLASWRCQPEYFSPNGDGYRDAVSLEYHFEQGGYWAQVYIFDRDGQLRRTLEPGLSAGTSGSFFWQGEDDQGALCESGIYIAVLRYLMPQGGESKKQCTVVLSRKS